MNNTEYNIFEVNNKSYLFTSDGFRTTPFNQIILREFKNEQMQFFICTLNERNILIFSNGSEFVQFLLEMGVNYEVYEIINFNYREKPTGYDNLEVSLNDGYKLNLAVSHLDGYHSGCYLKGSNGTVSLGYEGDNFDTHFPRLNKLNETSAKLISTGEIDDENYKQHLERANGCLASVLLLSTSIILFSLLNL